MIRRSRRNHSPVPEASVVRMIRAMAATCGFRENQSSKQGSPRFMPPSSPTGSRFNHLPSAGSYPRLRVRSSVVPAGAKYPAYPMSEASDPLNVD
jgi:hypothetical protein